MRSALVAVFLAAPLAACPPPGGSCTAAGSTGTVTKASQERVVLTGLPETLHFEASMLGCVPAAEVRVTAQVLDPDNIELPTLVDGVRFDSLVIGADVHFTPVGPGNHHVLVRFEPNLGIQQGDAVAVADRRDEHGIEVQVPTGTACDAVTLMPSGAVLCQHASTFKLDVFRSGRLVNTVFGTSTYVSQGNVVWTGGADLTRWEDRGTGSLMMSGSVNGAPGAQLKLLPGGDVLEINSSHIYRTGFDAGVVVQPYPPLEASFQKPVAVSPGGVRVLSVSTMGACVASVPGQGPPRFGCDDSRAGTAAASAADHGGIWAGSLNLDGVLHYYPATDDLPLDGGFVAAVRFKPPNFWSVVDVIEPLAEASVPGLGTHKTSAEPTSALPRLRGTAVVLESYAPTGGTARGDDVQVLVTAADGTMRVVQRGP